MTAQQQQQQSQELVKEVEIIGQEYKRKDLNKEQLKEELLKFEQYGLYLYCTTKFDLRHLKTKSVYKLKFSSGVLKITELPSNAVYIFYSLPIDTPQLFHLFDSESGSQPKETFRNPNNGAYYNNKQFFSRNS